MNPLALVRNMHSADIRENALNRMCHSLGHAQNRKRFRAFPEAYCHGYGLTREEIHAVTDLDVARLLDLGANLERIDILTKVFGIGAVQLWTEQTGLGSEELHQR